MKKVYISNDKPTPFKKMLDIFESKDTSKLYEVVIVPLRDVDTLEYKFEKYPEFLFFGYAMEWNKFK